jgi:phage-related protein
MEASGHKEAEFVGRALDELKAFPDAARRECGHGIDTVQAGDTPYGSKPMPRVGKGAREICVSSDDGWFRVFYVAEIEGRVWVLHAFQKKTNQTPLSAIKIGAKRYAEAVRLANAVTQNE